jgi:hypothetical protein
MSGEAEKFQSWLEQQGCRVEITQENDGGGYVCMDVTTPTAIPDTFDLTVQDGS